MPVMTMDTLRYTYRLRPGRQAERALIAQWDACRWVWNQCVQACAQAHESGTECGAAALDKMLTTWRSEHAWLAAGSSVAQQQTVRDFAAARTKALMDRKNKLKGRRRGMPRFKSKNLAAPSMNFTRRGFSLRADTSGRVRLILPGKTCIPVVWSRELPADPSSVRVYRDHLGCWYASFVVAVERDPLPAPQDAPPIGIDWGVSVIATTTQDDYDLKHPQYRKNAQARLARYQRMMARRRPAKGAAGSKGYRKAKHAAAKTHAKIARRRTDQTRKWARRLVADHTQIAVEDFRPGFLARSSMAAKSADAGIAAAKAALIHMAAKHERDLRLVNPAHTTMDCSTCGARATHRLALSERTYTCTACGMVRPRDKNSAAVMVARAGFNPACVEGIRPVDPSGSQAA